MTEEQQPETQENTEAQVNDNNNEPRFLIQRIYIKDVSFESPNTPAVYAEEWKPETNLQMNSEAKPAGADYYEVTLKLTVTVKSQEKTAFLVEIAQAGVFEIAGYSDDEMNHLLAAYCPSVLFPYAREAVANLVSKGSFPEMHLSPINFDALYAQRVE
jgi:preprotein translocase subunit SecB